MMDERCLQLITPRPPQALIVGHYVSPMGDCWLAVADDVIYYLGFVSESAPLDVLHDDCRRLWPHAFAHALENNELVAAWGDKIFLSKDALTLGVHGTAFQLAVWQALLDIPLGQTRSYSEIAASCGHPKAYRAAGTAIGHNPISYLIPCHRVLARDGRLGGYRWGLACKRRLLAAEGVV